MKYFAVCKNFPNNVYSTFFPLYVTSIFLGLSPLGTKNSNRRRQFFFSYFPVTVVLFFTVIYFSLIIYILYTFGLVESVLCRIRFYQDLFSALLYFCQIVAGCVFARKIVHIFGNIDRADQMLRSLNIEVSYKKTFLRIIIYMIAVFMILGTILLLVVTTDTFLACYSCRMHNVLTEILTYYLPFIANFLMELQYFQYLNILRLKYQQLNKCLLKKAGLNSSKIDFEHVTTITQVNPKPTTQDEPSDLSYVNDITKIHMILTDTARLVNKVFCFQQLLKIAISFVSIITALFMVAMLFAVKEPSRLRIDTLFFMWTFCSALDMFTIVWISAETCKEANLCPIILHRIRNSTSNDKMKSLIDLHSLQMYHSKLTFSVCGLFPLDYSLLFSVVAGTTTYLVILIQFNVDMVKAFDNQTIHQAPK